MRAGSRTDPDGRDREVPLDLSRSPLVFALPVGSDAPSGGNLYNRNLIDALTDLLPVETTDFAGAARMLAAGTPGTYFVDTLELRAAGTLRPTAPHQYLGLVVHHLPSLEPGLAQEHSALEMEAANLPRFDLLLATSEFTERWLSRASPHGQVVVVPPAASTWSNLSRCYAPPLSALVVANLIPRKGVLPLLRALADLGPAPYSLRVIGRFDLDRPYADACQRALSECRALSDRVELAGPVPHGEMGSIYDASDLFVSAAAMETFGMALQEARAHGLPILAQDAGHVRQHFTHGENGRLLTAADDVARELVTLAGDDKGMSELFERAQRMRWGSGYTWRDAAERFIARLKAVRLPDRSG